MKSNEAPEKIYMPNELLSEEWTRHIEGEDIEYTRTDAFIEKAGIFLYEKLNSGEMECSDIVVFIEKFRNYMKGE